jgi:hypothetical protein
MITRPVVTNNFWRSVGIGLLCALPMWGLLIWLLATIWR